MEKALERFENIDSAPENGRTSAASAAQDLVEGSDGAFTSMEAPAGSLAVGPRLTIRRKAGNGAARA
jgi:hypothetical protein